MYLPKAGRRSVVARMKDGSAEPVVGVSKTCFMVLELLLLLNAITIINNSSIIIINIIIMVCSSSSSSSIIRSLGAAQVKE